MAKEGGYGQNLLQRSTEQLWPVANGHDGMPGMDIIKMIALKQPRTLYVVHQEADL